MNIRHLVLLFVAPWVAACADGAPPEVRPAPSSAPPPTVASETPACREDADCTRPWHPGREGCGSIDRCVEGRCLRPAAVTGTPDATTGRITFETSGGERSYGVEVVAQAFETSRGLMCREFMRPDWGMLFLLATTRPQSFWMKNTLIPLDMLFFDEAWKVVGVVERAEPRTLTSRGVQTPSRYVLELNAGEAGRAGIGVGAQARFYPPRR